jgi:hypothetical protein
MAEVNLDVAMQSTSEEILSKVANGVEPSFRSPIKYENVSVGSTPVTGTGKGIIFARSTNSAYTHTIIIDGKTLVNDGKIASSDIDVFEFKESFSLSSTVSSKTMGCRIVFY